MRIESSTIGMESARSFTASRTNYNRFVLKDYIQGGANTGTNVTGQELGMGNMKEQTTQNQSESGEDSEKNRMLTRSGISDLQERVRREVYEFRFPVGEQSIQCSITIGVALHRTGDTIDRTITHADNSLYYGKCNGKNQVVFEKNPENL